LPVTFPDSSTAEQSTVNRQVLGSNPSQGAIYFNLPYPFSMIKNHTVRRRNFLRVFAFSALATISGGKFSHADAAVKAKQIVKLTKLPVGGTFNFTHSAQGMPAVLFRTKTGVFAYSAICTHQGCTVAYNVATKRLKCPCHGAEFDPLKNGTPLGGLAQTPLAKIKVAVSGSWIVEA
jgi:Rieske Fe-S protein